MGAFALFESGTSYLPARYRPMQVLAVPSERLLKSVIRMGGAAVVAGLFVFLTSGAPKANDAQANDANASMKVDRLAVVVKGAACSLHGWPHFERSCQFDLRKPDNQARTVRVLALRLQP